MTQKELLYVEDAIGHEKNIISILKETLNYLESEELVNFIQKELEFHQERNDNLINLLKEESYE